MGGSGYSGEDVAKAMLNSTVGWVPKSRTGSHLILEWEPPASHEHAERRTISIPLNNPLPEGTFRSLAKDAGADEVEEFEAWIDSNL